MRAACYVLGAAEKTLSPTDELTEAAVVAFALDYPAYGQAREQ